MDRLPRKYWNEQPAMQEAETFNGAAKQQTEFQRPAQAVVRCVCCSRAIFNTPLQPGAIPPGAVVAAGATATPSSAGFHTVWMVGLYIF